MVSLRYNKLTFQEKCWANSGSGHLFAYPVSVFSEESSNSSSWYCALFLSQQEGSWTTMQDTPPAILEPIYPASPHEMENE